MTIKFYKDSDNRWYAYLPDLDVSKAELEMVSGADDMLNIASEGESEVSLLLSIDEFEGSNILKLLREDELIGGGWYMMENYLGINFNMELWLCDVTRLVFGNIPEVIHFVKV